jgi:hypothetical protein
MSTPTLPLFEQLLAKARAQQASRERLSQQTETQQEKAARHLAAQMARFQWHPSHAVVLIERLTCLSCGSSHESFQGFGLAMRRKEDGLLRILATPVRDPAYSLIPYVTPRSQPVCLTCLFPEGIPNASPEIH